MNDRPVFCVNNARLGTALTPHQRNQILLRDDIVTPICEWLRLRSEEMQSVEDSAGRMDDECQPQLHVRFLKGARMDCDGIRAELEQIIKR